MLPALVLAGQLAGCTGFEGAAPVKTYQQYANPRSGNTHRVSAGDTLYSIAWIYGLDYRDLAARNGIREPYTIYPGQRLKLDLSARRAAKTVPDAGLGAPTRDLNEAPKPAPDGASAPSPAARKAPPRAPTAPSRKAAGGRTAAAQPAAKPPATANGTRVRTWAWPANGEVVTSFAQSGRKGVNISGSEGQPITAAADGRVVYAGGGLRGYGELIIVKHNKRFLSAYAHNKRILVKEGDEVRIGQRIADMGSTGTDNVMLHFEIRRDGIPVDPVRYLPR